jgi:hypothetical protein
MQNETAGLLSPGAHEVPVDGLSERHRVPARVPSAWCCPAGRA